MKKPKLLFALLFSLALSQICFAQEKPALEMADSVTEPNCELLLAMLDNQAIKVRNEPNSTSYVVFYGGANPIENKFYESFIKGHAKMRKLEETQNKFLIAKDEKVLRVESWISRNGSKPEIVEQKTSYVLPDDNKRILFVEDSVEVAKIEGKLEYIGNGACPSCCISHISLSLLSEFLIANPKFSAEIAVFNDRKSRANQLIKLISDDAVKEFSIPRNNIKITYGGIDEGISHLPGNISSVKIWLVPKGETK